jgi:hypothetical protein
MSKHDDVVRLVDVGETQAIARISSALSIPDPESEALLGSLEELSISNARFSTKNVFPRIPSGSFGLMCLIRNYTIDIGAVALTCLCAILGFTPLGPAVSLVNDVESIRGAVTELTESEKVLYCFLREVTDGGRTKIEIAHLYRAFLSHDGENPFFKNEEQIMKALDGLAEKNVLKLTVHEIAVKR